MISLERMPAQGPVPFQKALKTGVCNARQSSSKKCGKGDRTYRVAMKAADERLARLFKADRRGSWWERFEKYDPCFDELDYSDHELSLLENGDPIVGLGPCCIDPEIWFDLREVLYAHEALR